MTVSKDWDTSRFLQDLTKPIQEEIDKQVTEIYLKAQKDLENNIKSFADKLALRLISNYQIHTQQDRIIIEVKKL